MKSELLDAVAGVMGKNADACVAELLVVADKGVQEPMLDGLVGLSDATVSVNVGRQVVSHDPRLLTTSKAPSTLMPPPKTTPSAIDLESAKPDPRLLSKSKFPAPAPAPVQPRHTAYQ